MNPDLKITEYPPRSGLQCGVSPGICVEHVPTGTCVIVIRHRHQHRNKSDALRALCTVFEYDGHAPDGDEQMEIPI